jgi:hypothetical protein
VHVAQINEGSWVCKLAFHQEVSNFNWIVIAGFLDDLLNVLEPVETSTTFNVLEIDVRVVSVG